MSEGEYGNAQQQMSRVLSLIESAAAAPQIFAIFFEELTQIAQKLQNRFLAAETNRLANPRSLMRTRVYAARLQMIDVWCKAYSATGLDGGFNVQMIHQNFTRIVDDLLWKTIRQKAMPKSITTAKILAAALYGALLQYGAGGRLSQIIPEWNEVAMELSRYFRYEYERAITLVRWYTFREPSKQSYVPFPQKISAVFIWGRRKVYAFAAGYGLRPGKFTVIVLLLILTFTGLFAFIPIAVHFGTIGCPSTHPTGLSAEGILWAFEASISSLTTIGSVTPCNGLWFALLRASEAVLGYVILGMLVSMLIQNFIPPTAISVSLPREETT